MDIRYIKVNNQIPLCLYFASLTDIDQLWNVFSYFSNFTCVRNIFHCYVIDCVNYLHRKRLWRKAKQNNEQVTSFQPHASKTYVEWRVTSKSMRRVFYYMMRLFYYMMWSSQYMRWWFNYMKCILHCQQSSLWPFDPSSYWNGGCSDCLSHTISSITGENSINYLFFLLLI